LEKIIKDSLNEIHSESKITVKLSIEDFPHLEEKFTSSRTECISDPTLNSGEAKIDHQHGYLDLSIKSRLAELREHFKNVRSSGDVKDA
ncbi:MAG: FliH/SctL family protein, partial [Lentisphaeraceae bacterium]|nr:FliH/SctL family protein [Lentisphaeraceae bacterium]